MLPSFEAEEGVPGGVRTARIDGGGGRNGICLRDCQGQFCERAVACRGFCKLYPSMLKKQKWNEWRRRSDP